MDYFNYTNKMAKTIYTKNRAFTKLKTICLGFIVRMASKDSMNRVALGISLGILFGFSCAYMWFKVGTYEVILPEPNIR